jgi:hypothetical protein
MGGDVVHILLAVFFTWITSKEGVGAGPVLSAMPLQVLLTGLAALALYPLLRRVDPGSERPEIGALR